MKDNKSEIQAVVYKNILDFANIGLLRFFSDKSIDYIDGAVLRLFEIDDVYKNVDELKGLDMSKLFMSNVSFDIIIKKIFLDGFINSFEYRVKTLKGNDKFFLFDAYMIKEKDGKEKLIQLLIRDITKIKKLENDFIDTEKRHKLLAENINDVIWLMSKDLTFTYISSSIEKILGINVNEFLKKDLSEVLTSDSYDFVMKKLKNKIDEASTKTIVDNDFELMEFKVINKNAETIWLETQFAYVLNDKKEVTGLMGVARNINNKKNLEQQLFQIQKMDAVGRLAGGIAHDFNNILSIISCYGQLALAEIKEDTNPEAFTNINEMILAANKGATLTKQLLLFSKKQNIQASVLDLNKVIENFSKMLKRIIGEENNLVTLLSEDLFHIYADISQIEQVLMNLVINARDALKDKCGYTIIKTENFINDQNQLNLPDSKQLRYVHFSVSDTGCGMDSETLLHVFEPFFTTKKDLGTGLGLATVYGIIKQSGGHIFINSVKNVWTKVDIYFPVPVCENKNEKAYVDLYNIEFNDLSGTETVLLINNDEALSKLFYEILQKNGYKVLIARTITEALEYSECYTDKINLLLTDFNMPFMNGVELKKKIKKNNSNIKTVFIADSSDREDLNNLLNFKEDGYILKPFTPDKLLNLLKKTLLD